MLNQPGRLWVEGHFSGAVNWPHDK
jgi:hypothetical protein